MAESHLVMPATPVPVTDADFDQTLRAYPLVVVDAWAPWCAPCLRLEPVIEGLARELAGQVVFTKLNVDENPRTANRYGVRGLPTMLVFRHGSLVDVVVGAVGANALRARFLAHAR